MHNEEINFIVRFNYNFGLMFIQNTFTIQNRNKWYEKVLKAITFE